MTAHCFLARLSGGRIFVDDGDLVSIAMKPSIEPVKLQSRLNAKKTNYVLENWL